MGQDMKEIFEVSKILELRENDQEKHIPEKPVS